MNTEIHESSNGQSNIPWNTRETTMMMTPSLWRRVGRKKRLVRKIFRKCYAHRKLLLMILTSATVMLTLYLSSHYAIPYTEWLPRSKMAAERCFLPMEEALPFFQEDLPLNCGVHRDVANDGRRLWPTHQKLHCCYQPVSMSEHFLLLPNDEGKGWRLPRDGVDAAAMGYELVVTSCEGVGRATLHFLEPPALTRAQATTPGVVSVVLVKVRGMDKHPLMATWNVLWKADAIHMDAYMQLDSSLDDRPDVLAALAGVPEFDFPSRCLRDSSGNCPWIWKRFADAGAATLLLEESPCVGDFATRPTDVWLRPLSTLMDTAHHEFDPGGGCPASPLKNKWLLPCLRAALRPETPGAGRFWAMVYVTAGDALDKELAEILEDVLKRAVVIVMADERLSVAVPTWFRDAFPKAMLNLRTNKRRYTTPFDVHETMLHLADVEGLHNISSDLQGSELNDVPGRSLFLPVPQWTLREAPAPSPPEKQVRRAASAMTSLLNQRLARMSFRCWPLSVRRVLRAESLGSDLLLVAETAPGGVHVQALMGLGDHEPGSVSLKSVVPADLAALCQHSTTAKPAADGSL